MKRTSSKRSRAGAFTLVELLVVMGVIAVLIGLLLPVISKAREHSKRTKCIANMRSIGHALFGYANTYRDRLPNGNPRGVWIDYDGSNRVMADFADELKEARVFHCPSDASGVPERIVTADQTLPDSARVSYEFYSLYFPPEHGPLLTRLRGRAPLAWDIEGGSAVPHRDQNHGSRGGNVLFADGHVAWTDLGQWDNRSEEHTSELQSQSNLVCRLLLEQKKKQ